MLRSKALWIILAMAAGLAALGVVLRGQYARFAAEHLRGQLATVPDRRASLLMGQAAELGDRGIPVLVEALGSQRESVARAAKDALDDRLDEWDRLPGHVRARKLAILADALAGQIERFGVTARSDAADLAKRILRWRTDSQVVDSEHLLASCERVFRASSGDAGMVSKPPDFGEPSPARTPRDDTPLRPDLSATDRSQLPGGGLRIPGALQVPLAGMPERSRQDEGSPMDDVRADALSPAPLPSNPVRSSEPPPVSPRPLLPIAGPEAQPIEHSAQTPLRQLSAAEPLRGSNANRWNDPAEVETVELMRRLWATDRLSAARARTELVRRGFGPAALDMARRIFDPDPQVRKELAERLPEQSAVDAIPWLLLLARDADADVRLTAIGRLGTTGDPRLLQRVEEMARHDPDARIRHQAAQLAKRRTAKWR